jgi:hypothetical protein
VSRAADLALVTAAQKLPAAVPAPPSRVWDAEGDDGNLTAAQLAESAAWHRAHPTGIAIHRVVVTPDPHRFDAPEQTNG